MGLTLHQVPASRGLGWVRAGIGEFFHHPWIYSGLFVAFMGLATVVTVLGVFGEVLMLTGLPLLSLAYMMATAASLSGHRPGFGVVLAPWRLLAVPKRRALLSVCLAYALSNLVVLQLCELIDHGALEAFMDAVANGGTDADKLAQLAQAPGVTAGAFARLIGTSLLSLPFWYAPALVVWSDQGVGQALFSSALALWRNRGALLVYALGWLAAMMLAALFMGAITLLMGLNSAAGIVVLPMALVLTCAFYVSLFFMFRDSFASPPAAPGIAFPDSPA